MNAARPGSRPASPQGPGAARRRGSAAALAIAVATLLSACGPSTYLRMDHEFAALPAECCPLLLGLEDAVPPGSLLVGEVRYGESGFSTNCSYPENMERIRRQACLSGADLVKVTAQNNPNFVSTCYRVRADLYRSNAGPDSGPAAREGSAEPRGACRSVLTRRFLEPQR